MISFTRIGDAGKFGRGIFASRSIPSKRLIFKCPTWHLPAADMKLIDKTSISGNYFSHPNIDGDCLLVLGDLSLINHSSTPNAEVEILQSSPKLGWMVYCYTTRRIKPGEQIFIDYGPEHIF